ncbi:MAG: class I SAM-dependent methyltransferase [Patescibacteria group bacterium]|jgi:SAM-dependent methyltransferase
MNKKVLDLGCGNGDNVFYLSQKGDDVVGVDLDVNEAIRKYPGLRFLTMPAEKLEFEDNSFDEIYSYDVLEHVGDLDQTIAEIKRVLKSGGIWHITVPNARSEKVLLKINPKYFEQVGHRRMFEAGVLKNILKNNGFEVIKSSKKGFFNFFIIWLMFKLGRDINSQKGDFDETKFYYFLKLINQFFDVDLTFQTKAKFVPIWMVTLPIAFAFNQIVSKTIRVVARKKAV